MIKIAIIVLIAFIIVFSGFYGLYEFQKQTIEEIKFEQFYELNFDPKVQKIFLYGSSHVGQLDDKIIENEILKHHENYGIYNLAEPADLPEQRLEFLEQDILLKPKIIFYGLSYRDFIANSDIDRNVISEFFNKFNKINPKFVTLNTIKNNISEKEPSKSNGFIYLTTSEIFPNKRMQEKIKTVEEILTIEDSSIKPNEFFISSKNNIQHNSLREIISELQKNDIKVIIFVVPIHENYLNLISNSTKNEFRVILFDLKNEFNIKVYDYSNKYENASIWRDFDHIAYNVNSTQYSIDVSEILLREIEE